MRRYIVSGIDGLIVPEVETADEVRHVHQVIDACSPEGREDFMLIALIESEAGCNHVDEILATGLIDAVLVGCGDLAVSLGLPRKGNHAMVRELTLRVLRPVWPAGTIRLSEFVASPPVPPPQITVG